MGGSGEGTPSPYPPVAGGGGGAGANTNNDSSDPDADKSYPGVVIVKTGAFSNASGVWTMDDVYEGRLAGTWGS